MTLMKNLNKIFLGLAALTSFAAVTSCQNDFENDIPELRVPVAVSTPNISILELKNLYWEDEVNYIDTIPYVYNDIDDITGEVAIFPRNADGSRKEYDKNFVIAGRVVSSDRAGNVYKKIVIQDESAAIALSVNANSLYNQYRIGQEIVVRLNGMYIGKYNGGQQLGFPMFYEKNHVWEATFMPYEYFVDHIELNGLPDASKIDTLSIANLSELPLDPAQLTKYQSRIVRFNNVTFEDGGVKEFTDGHKITTNRIITDTKGGSAIVRTSGYSIFRSQMLPEGYGDVVAILDYYATSADADAPWQLTLNDYAGCMNFGNPTIELGTKDNPYTVEQAIAVQQEGKQASGWVTGYIVGAVKEGVEGSIASNEDIAWGADADSDLTLVIGPTADCTEIAECLVVYLEPGSAFREKGNLLDNPENLGKSIQVKGTLDSYMGTYGITENNGTDNEFVIEGQSTPGGEVNDGNGSEASPYNCAQVIALNPNSTTESPAGGSQVWVKGYIVGYMPSAKTYFDQTIFGAPADQATNIVIGPTPDCTDYNLCVGVQLPKGDVRTALNLMDNPGNLGKEVMLFGDVMLYCKGPGLKNTSKFELGEGGGTTPGGGGQPSTGEEKGDGTMASPYNVARALAIIASGSYTSDKVYIEGIVSSIKDINNTYKSATYYLSDDGSTATQLYVFGGKGLNGEPITTSDYIKVGDKLLIQGELTLYGSTPEVTTGSSIISINGGGTAGGGDSGDGGDGGDTGGDTGGDNSIDNPLSCADVIALNPQSTQTSPEGGAGVWVKGYIVGYMPSSGTYLSSTVFGIPTDVMTNIVIGPTADCTDHTKCVGIQLPKGDVRTALNLQENPNNLGKEVLLFGDVMKYASGPGLKNTSNSQFVD